MRVSYLLILLRLGGLCTLQFRSQSCLPLRISGCERHSLDLQHQSDQLRLELQFHELDLELKEFKVSSVHKSVKDGV